MRGTQLRVPWLLAVTLAACTTGDPARPSTPAAPVATAAAAYVPKAQFCVAPPPGPSSGSPLCSTVPGNIGPDPALDITIAYNGLVGVKPTSPANDVQTPFDNLSWQTFVALNWASGKERQPAHVGLQGQGRRVWESWPRVSEVFGNGRVRASCTVPPGLTVFQIASNGQGQPVAQNEEYIQAATGDPAIDVSGNWTIYERRLNGVEVAYLEAPGGNARWNLTTAAGQRQLIKDGGTVSFPSLGIPGPPTGAIEIKAAWRVLDPSQRAANAQRYYLVPALLTVAPDLVTRPPGRPAAPICAQVDLGLVGMHIIQKNPKTQNSLLPEWFWSTFEHEANAPLATQACDVTSPSTCPLLGQLACPVAPPGNAFSYFNAACPGCPTNQPPTAASTGTPFAWSPVPPFARAYLVPAAPGAPPTVGTQISRCWKIYELTDQLNVQWRDQLRRIGSVFQHYVLVGTQWGANTTSTPDPKVPLGGVPNFLSNSVVETYLQTLSDPNDPFGNGSCIACHRAATLVDNTTPSNLSFLPGLVTPGLVRRAPRRATAR